MERQSVAPGVEGYQKVLARESITGKFEITVKRLKTTRQVGDQNTHPSPLKSGRKPSGVPSV